MMRFLQRALRKQRVAPIAYDDAKRLSQSGNPAERRRVATHGGARPEVLYYLAVDPDPTVRAAVAANDATPVQADLLLARDRDEAVRQDLARKIGRLAPGLNADEQDRLRRMTYEVLEILVRDQVVKVRQIIAEALKDVTDAPPEMIQLLARDGDLAVAGPVLQFSPMLDDEDLLEIIASTPIAGALEAMARRRDVSDGIALAIAGSSDIAAVTALLENPSAQIREEMLDKLIDRARDVPPWHQPLVRRPKLSSSAIQKLALFVADNLLFALRERRDLDPAAARAVERIVLGRLADEHLAASDAQTSADPFAATLDRVRRQHDAGQLNDDSVTAALRESDRGYVRAALVVRADLPIDSIDKIIAAQSAKGLVSLAWRAGLAMRTAVLLQSGLAHLPPPSIIRGREDGSYPLSPDAMRWQLDFLTGCGTTTG
ncbi:MAG: uncharacterized protein JWL84_550 [Rhodospirillales bacterium]|nr:uncharacterized protein [Rhodospirillales bacterium]